MHRLTSRMKHPNLSCFAAAIILLVGWNGLTHGQDNGASASADLDSLVPIPRDPLAAGNAGNIEATLNSLLQTVKRAQDEIVGPNALPQPVTAAIVPAALPSVVNANDQRGQVSDLKKRIDLLRRLRRRVAIQESIPTTRPTSVPRSTSPSIPSALRSAPATDIQIQQPTLSAIEENLQPDVAGKETAKAQPAIVQARQILKSPVDHLSLAESLYRTKNYAASLKTLKSIESDQLDASDKTWMELLAALCHRRLGNLEKAEAQFREISNAKIADRSVPLARWWLKQTEMSGTAMPTLTAISSDLDSLIERSKNHVQ